MTCKYAYKIFAVQCWSAVTSVSCVCSLSRGPLSLLIISGYVHIMPYLKLM